MEYRKWGWHRVKGILTVKGNLWVTVVPEALRATRKVRVGQKALAWAFVKKMKLLEHLMCLSIYLGDLDNWQKG